ncbi:MAG TPA: hypothetical protein VJV79_12625 [Polyangiaceae bacterium]|nr:hypothetical protein [Polyangiaceae bacterium]
MAAKKLEPQIVKLVQQPDRKNLVELGHVPPPRPRTQAAAPVVPPAPKKKK